MPAPFHYIESENFVLNEYGDYFYNECFEKTDIDFFAKQKYKKIIPYLEYFSNKVTNLLKSEDEDEELLLIEREAEENE